MDQTKIRVPDFSADESWVLKSWLSIFCDLKTGEFFDATAELHHQTNNTWLAYKSIYFHKNGLAIGKEINYFNKGPVLRFWGLRPISDKDHYELFAILDNNVWRTFPVATHIRKTEFFGKRDTGATSVKIEVQAHSNPEILCSVRVHK